MPGNEIPFRPVVHFANRLACRPGETFGPRVIEDYQWLFVEKGTGTIMIGGKVHSVGPGCLLGYGPGVPHRIAASAIDPFVLYGLHFLPDEQAPEVASRKAPPRIADIELPREIPEEWLARADEPTALIAPCSRIGLWALPYFEELVKEYALKDDFSPLSLRATLSQLYVRLRRRAVPSGGENAIVERIRRLLEERAEEAYRMEWLEECTGYSHDYASKTYKESRGLSPHADHQRMKLRSAQRYLESTALSVTEIADKLHFGSIHYFCKWFRRMAGLSPSAYRSRKRTI